MKNEKIASLLGIRRGESKLARVLSASSRIIILALAICPVSAKAAAVKPVDCFDDCEQVLVGCLLAAGGNPTLEARCQDNYDKCCADCMLLP